MDYYSEVYFTNYTSKNQQLVVCEIIITTLVNKEPFKFKRKFFSYLYSSVLCRTICPSVM